MTYLRAIIRVRQKLSKCQLIVNKPIVLFYTKLLAFFLANCALGRYNLPLSGPLAQLAEQLTFNQLVRGSNPLWPTQIVEETSPICDVSSFLLCLGDFAFSALLIVKIYQKAKPLDEL